MSDTAHVEKIGRVSTQSVHKGTRKHWDEWIAILDGLGARAWSHKEMATYLRTRRKLSPWWQHEVATGYEIYIGRKEAGRNAKGDYALTATKSLAASAPKVWKWLFSPQGLEQWLQPLFPVKLKSRTFFETRDGFFGEVRTLKAGRSLRLSWKESDLVKPSYLQILVVPRTNQDRCLVVFQHNGLAEARLQKLLRQRWRKFLDDLPRLLTSSKSR